MVAVAVVEVQSELLRLQFAGLKILHFWSNVVISYYVQNLKILKFSAIRSKSEVPSFSLVHQCLSHKKMPIGSL
jgi:hypothetical protein